MRRVVKVAASFCRVSLLAVKALATLNKPLLKNLALFGVLAALFFPIALSPGWFSRALVWILPFTIMRVGNMTGQVRRNLDIVLGEGHGVKPRDIAVAMATEYIAMAINRLSDESDILRRYTPTAALFDMVEKAQAGDTPMFLVGTHLGQPQAAAAVLAALGFCVYTPTEQLQPSAYSDFMDWMRSPGDSVCEPLSLATLRKMLRYIRTGEALPAIMIDRVPEGTGKFYPFGGGYVEFALGPARIARASHAQVYFGVAVDEGDGKPIVHVEGPFICPRTDDEDADLDDFMRQLLACYENWLRDYPKQWVGAPFVNVLNEEDCIAATSEELETAAV